MTGAFWGAVQMEKRGYEALDEYDSGIVRSVFYLLITFERAMCQAPYAVRLARYAMMSSDS